MNMDIEKIVYEIIDILEAIIDGNEDVFHKQKSFKVRPGYGYDKFYLDHIDGLYDMSLQSLIHYIMYEEEIYPMFLNEQQLADVKHVIENDPETIYSPSDNDELIEFLDKVYADAIKFVGEYLIELGFEVEDTFADYLDEQEES